MPENEPAQAKTPWHLWAVGAIILLWSAMGVFDFMATVTHFEPYMAQFSQEMKDYWYGFPWWMFAIWGLGAASGLAGAVLLLLKNRLAVAALMISFACAAISIAISIIRPGPEGPGGGGMAVVIIILAAGFVLYARQMRARGVLR